MLPSHDYLASPRLAPLNLPLGVYLTEAPGIVLVALPREVEDIVANRFGKKTRAFASVRDLATSRWYEEQDGREVGCVMVNTDCFDDGATERLQTVLEMFAPGARTFIFGLTSFMPGAYRDFVQRMGASDCILTSTATASL